LHGRLDIRAKIVKKLQATGYKLKAANIRLEHRHITPAPKVRSAKIFRGFAAFTFSPFVHHRESLIRLRG